MTAFIRDKYARRKFVASTGAWPPPAGSHPPADEPAAAAAQQAPPVDTLLPLDDDDDDSPRKKLEALLHRVDQLYDTPAAAHPG